MSDGTVVAAALGSALAASASTVLQHRAARRAPRGEPGRLLRHLLTDVPWIAGLVAGTLGLVLHVVALSAGQLVLVQPLLVSGILFALPLSVALEGSRPSARDWLLALVLVASLSTFLLSARPSGGSARAPAGELLGAGGVTVLLILGAGVLGLRVGPGRRRAALLGTAAGTGFGLTAALMKQAVAVAAPFTAAALARSWSVWAVAGTGALSIAVTQLAYRAGPLGASLPALTVGDPVVAAALGALMFRERLNQATASLTVAGMSLLTMLTVAAALSLRTANAAEPPPAAAPCSGGDRPAGR